jgi:hypothetical protein
VEGEESQVGNRFPHWECWLGPDQEWERDHWAATKAEMFCDPKNPVLPNQEKKIGRRPLGLQERHATSQIHSHSSDMCNPMAASPLALSVSNLAASWLQRAKRPKRAKRAKRACSSVV